MTSKRHHILWITCIAILCSLNLTAQDKLKATRIQVDYFKKPDQTEQIVAILRVREDRYLPLEGAILRFYNITDTSNILLSEIPTDRQGQAILVLDNTQGLYRDSSGMLSFLVEYEGDSLIKSSQREVEFLPAKLSMSFFQEDTVKYILIEANETDSRQAPIEGVEINFYIKGTFSLLSIGTETTDEDGRVKTEFPVYMPGDTVGMLTMVSKIEEHDRYGNLEAQGKINWGQPVPLKVVPHRGLGDTDAPLWMVYTLIVLLSAVWFHYLYVVYLIIRVKRAKNDHLIPAHP